MTGTAPLMFKCHSGRRGYNWRGVVTKYWPRSRRWHGADPTDLCCRRRKVQFPHRAEDRDCLFRSCQWRKPQSKPRPSSLKIRIGRKRRSLVSFTIGQCSSIREGRLVSGSDLPPGMAGLSVLQFGATAVAISAIRRSTCDRSAR